MRSKPAHTLVRKTAAALFGGVLLATTLSACGAKDYEGDTATDASGTCSYEAAGASAGQEVDLPDPEPAYEGEVLATIATSVGDIDLVLDADAAPCTVNSFASLAEQGYFDDTTCHRIIGGFMIQCGDPGGTGAGGPGYSYADELNGNEQYPEGTLAMANAGPDTNGSQFFLVSGDASHLTTHTVFGAVTEDSLDIIREVDDAWSTGDELPVDIETVTIRS